MASLKKWLAIPCELALIIGGLEIVRAETSDLCKLGLGLVVIGLLVLVVILKVEVARLSRRITEIAVAAAPEAE